MTIKILSKKGQRKIYMGVNYILYVGDIMHLRIYQEINYPQHYTRMYELNIFDILKMEIIND